MGLTSISLVHLPEELWRFIFQIAELMPKERVILSKTCKIFHRIILGIVYECQVHEWLVNDEAELT